MHDVIEEVSTVKLSIICFTLTTKSGVESEQKGAWSFLQMLYLYYFAAGVNGVKTTGSAFSIVITLSTLSLINGFLFQHSWIWKYLILSK